MKRFLYGTLVVVLILISAVLFFAKPTLAINTFSCTDVTEISQLECEALVALYNSTNGPGWTNNTNWLVTNTPSDWYGVTVTTGHISQIILQYNNLMGTMPAELGNLSNLYYLDLSTNQLSGSIPVELGNLTNLTYLQIRGNLMNGSIPVELSNLTNLTFLNLGWNQLSGSIPVQLGNLTNLTYLSIEWNQLSGSIPAELGDLSNLTYLDLINNQLIGSIPAELGNLTNLTYLELGGNQLSGGIPAQLGNLANLITLGLEGNQLSGSIPAQLGNLTNLTSLNLAWNQLNGSIPAGLGNLTNLTSLDLYLNQISGSIPAELGNLINLTRLSLGANQLSGSIPAQLGNLSNLTALGLGGNQLSGGIPAQLGNLANLITLGLEGNQLSGSIPAQLGNLSNLTGLGLGWNQLSGNIPSELGNLHVLGELYINDNPYLEGPLPMSLTTLTLNSFAFNNTGLCEPNDPAFQAWLNSIPDLFRTGVLCSGTGYSISGQVTHIFGNGFEGVTVTAGPYSAITDSEGNYTIYNAPAGIYPVVPNYSGYSFIPSSRFVSVPPDTSEVNFIGKSTPKFKILFVPLNWENSQEAFISNAQSQFSTFLNEVPLNNCLSQVQEYYLEVSTQNYDHFSCSSKNCAVNSIRNFVNDVLHIDPTDYDVIVGLTETSPCAPIAGCSNGTDTIWVTTSYNSVMAHELGHIYNLEDEYCSNQAGSTDDRCNDGDFWGDGSVTGDVNWLDADSPCDCPPDGSPDSSGMPCCNYLTTCNNPFGCFWHGGLVAIYGGQYREQCDSSDYGEFGIAHVNYGICCQGNKNDAGGRSIMSYANATDPRYFDIHDLDYLSSLPELSCSTQRSLLESNETDLSLEGYEPIIDINLLIHPDNTVIPEDISFLYGRATPELVINGLSGDYSINITDGEDNIIWHHDFSVYFDYIGPMVLGEDYSSISYDVADFSLRIPKICGMNMLKIYHGDELIYSYLLPPSCSIFLPITMTYH